MIPSMERIVTDPVWHDTLVAPMLAQCLDRQDRVAILDMWGIDKLTVDFKEDDLAAATTAYRKNISGLQTQFLRYGMAYAPFLQTSIVDPTEVSFVNFDADSQAALWTLMEREARRLFDDPKPARARHGGCELRACNPAHRRLNNRVSGSGMGENAVHVGPLLREKSGGEFRRTVWHGSRAAAMLHARLSVVAMGWPSP